MGLNRGLDRTRHMAPGAVDRHRPSSVAVPRGFTGGRIYDSLLLACAAKCKAQAVYTGNLKHYQSLAPDLAPRMQTP